MRQAVRHFWIIVIIIGWVSPGQIKAQSDADRDFTASRKSGRVVIDGEVDEATWNRAEPVTRLVQQEPEQGDPASQRSVIRVLYDEEALYVGARLFDTAPDSIVERLGRRDSYLNADRFLVYLDPFHDHESGFYFGLNAAGTVYDGILYNDHSRDDDWNGVWQHAVEIDSNGWQVEMRIPFSQIRYDKQSGSVWGINFKREIARYNEEDFLVYVPREATGFVSYFPHMKGVKKVDPGGYFEMEPYLTSKASYLDYTAASPFQDGSDYQLNAGADFQTVLFGDLTLNGTINPDFGQVEVDPAVVNLSDVETFYPEKRPFFINGSNYFNFGDGGRALNLNINWPKPNFFYSRRIGRSPRGSTPNADYVDYPEATNIIGAAKVTGRIKGGWKVGAMQAVTARENARLSRKGDISRVSVHPPTYYSITRVENKSEQADRSIGMMATYTNRQFRRDALRNEMNKSALFVGADGYAFLDSDRTWVVSGWSGLSRITGTAEQMTRVQRNPVHYIQRPNADRLSVDSSASSMTGYGGYISLTRQRGNWLGLASIGILSPRFNLNDAGYLPYTNVINMIGTVGYQWTKPTDWYRRILIAGAFAQNMDFAGNNTGRGFWSTYDFTFANYYGLRINWYQELPSYDNRLTRGGPLTRERGTTKLDIDISTDDRKDLVFEWGGGLAASPEGSRSRSLEAEVEWKPTTNVSFSINPEYAYQFKKAHYLKTYQDPYAEETNGKRYVFAELKQRTFSSSVRVNWTFTPDLSLEMYVQPLISSGSYTNFKELERPKSFDFKIYGEGKSTYDEEQGIADPDGPGSAEPIKLRDPDFNYKSLRGNAVLRWQYQPGSTIYLVWTQTRSATVADSRFQLGESISKLGRTKPDNIFLIKFTYWFNAGQLVR